MHFTEFLSFSGIMMMLGSVFLGNFPIIFFIGLGIMVAAAGLHILMYGISFR